MEGRNKTFKDMFKPRRASDCLSWCITLYFPPFSPCRCEVGLKHWTQCNDTPVKFARFPVTGLVEGRSYVFRVRAVNKAGMSHPSRVSEPVAAMDPADRTRKGKTRSNTQKHDENKASSTILCCSVGHSAPWTGQIIVTEEEPVGEKPLIKSSQVKFYCQFFHMYSTYRELKLRYSQTLGAYS